MRYFNHTSTCTEHYVSNICDFGPGVEVITLIYTPSLRLATGQEVSMVKCGMIKLNSLLFFEGKTAWDCAGAKLEHTIQIQEYFYLR